MLFSITYTNGKRKGGIRQKSYTEKDMPAKSKAQQKLFQMALAVRKGDLPRSKAWKSVLKIADGDMTDEQIKDFCVLEKTNHILRTSEFVNEGL